MDADTPRPSDSAPMDTDIPGPSNSAPMDTNTPETACEDPDLGQSDSNDVAWLNINESGDLSDKVNACVERWKAAGPDSQKRMFSFFEVTGIFLSVCQHGHLMVMCDMRNSGEL